MVSSRQQRNRKIYKLTPEGLAKINKALSKITKNKPTWHGWLAVQPKNSELGLASETIKKILGATVGDHVKGGEEGAEESKILALKELLVAILEDKNSRILANEIKALKLSTDWKLVVLDVRKGTNEAYSQETRDALVEPDAKPTVKPLIANETFRAIPVWHGREELLANLQEALQDRTLRVMVLMGQGGIGKTSLAQKLLDIIQGDYEQAYFLGVNDGSSFDDLAAMVLGDLRVNCKTDDEVLAAICNLFSRQRCLLILDEVERILEPESLCAVAKEWGKLLNELAYKNHNSHVILTSRELPADLAERKGYAINRKLVRVEAIGGVALDASIAILKDNGLEDSEQDLQWIADQVGGNVFLLNQLAALGAGQKGYLRKRPYLVTRNSDPILQEQLARRTEDARDLLKRMAVLRIGITIEGLTFLRLYGEEDRFKNAIAQGKPVEFTDDELQETEAIIEQLTAASLVQSRYDEDCCSFLYDLHRITVDFLQKAYADSLPDLMKIAYKFYCTGKAINNPQSIEDLLPIIEAQHFAFRLGCYRESIYLVLEDLENLLKLWGHWNQLKDIYEAISPYIENYVDEFQKPSCLCKIGELHRNLGDFYVAKKYFLNALEISEKNEYETDIAYTLQRLAYIEGEKGDWDKAEEMLRRSLLIRKKLSDFAKMAIPLISLAEIERKRGNWNAAEEIAKEALSLFEKFDDRAGIAMYCELLGNIERSRENFDEAEILYKKAIPFFQELRDRNKIALFCSILGDMECDRGNWDKSEVLYRKAVQERQEIGNRRGVAISIAGLGRIELGRGNLDKAEEFLKQALLEMELLGIIWHIGATNFELAMIEKMRGNIFAAQEYYKKSNEIFGKLGAVKYLERINRRWNA